jgi:hypothetical protein
MYDPIPKAQHPQQCMTSRVAIYTVATDAIPSLPESNSLAYAFECVQLPVCPSYTSLEVCLHSSFEAYT